MTEKQKYKVGDRILFEVVVSEIDVDDMEVPYYISFEDRFGRWANEEELDALSVNLPPRPQVTQKVMDWYEETKKQKVDSTIRDWFVASSMPVDVREWFFGENHLENQHALATLIAYGPEAVEVIKEKKYTVKIKRTNQYLDTRYIGNGYIFIDSKSPLLFTKSELEEAGFGDVFDSPLFEVEEVVNG